MQGKAVSLHLLGAVSCVCYVVLGGLSRHSVDLSITQFLALIGGAWLFLGLAYAAPAHTIAPIWFWGVAFRVIGLFASPVLEDDWNRYLWDGRTFATTGNPYEKPPAAFFSVTNIPAPFQSILGQINNPEVPTIYGPVCQYAFVLGYWIAPGQLWSLKLILVLADLTTMFLLSRIVRPKQLLLYAWCPLLIQETAFNAHPDILGIAFMVAAVICTAEQRFVPAMLALAFAIAGKAFALLIAPLLLLRTPKKYWPLFAVSLLAIYAPFLGKGSLAEFAGLKAFASQWEFNSTVFAVVANAFDAAAAKWVCSAIILIYYVYYCVHWHLNHTETIPRGDWVFGALFLLSAVVNPWYLLWLLPFVAIFPSLPGVAALIVVILSYIHGLYLPDSGLRPYEHPLWVRWTEVLLVAAAGLAEIWRRKRSRPKAEEALHLARSS